MCTRATEISAMNQSVHFVFVQLGHGSFRLDNQKETIFAFSYSISLGACTCRARRRHAGLLFGVTMMLVAVPEINSPGNMFGTAVARVTEIGLGLVCCTKIGRAHV